MRRKTPFLLRKGKKAECHDVSAERKMQVSTGSYGTEDAFETVRMMLLAAMAVSFLFGMCSLVFRLE